MLKRSILRSAQLALLLAITGWIAYTASLSATFKKCIYDRQIENSQKKPIKETNEISGLGFFVDDAVIATDCFAAFGYENRNATTAIATAFIAIFTFTLWRSTGGMLRATNETIALARQEFIATHRPRIIVRSIAISHPNGHQAVDVHVVNIGESVAKIEFLECGLGRRKGEDWIARDVTREPGNIAAVIIQSGEGRILTPSIGYGDQEIFDDIFDDEATGKRAIETCAFGVIRYADENGIKRETGFFRILDPASRKFIASKDPGEEYQD